MQLDPMLKGQMYLATDEENDVVSRRTSNQLMLLLAGQSVLLRCDGTRNSIRPVRACAEFPLTAQMARARETGHRRLAPLACSLFEINFRSAQIQFILKSFHR